MPKKHFCFFFSKLSCASFPISECLWFISFVLMEPSKSTETAENLHLSKFFVVKHQNHRIFHFILVNSSMLVTIRLKSSLKSQTNYGNFCPPPSSCTQSKTTKSHLQQKPQNVEKTIYINIYTSIFLLTNLQDSIIRKCSNLRTNWTITTLRRFWLCIKRLHSLFSSCISYFYR